MFGGSFYNDWHGKNRYSPLWEDPRDAVSRGIYLTYRHALHHTSALIFSIQTTSDSFLPENQMKQQDKYIHDTLNQNHPMRILYNALIRFCVSGLENFFGNRFKILLRYEANAELNVVARWYSFRNLASIHKAYAEWLDIDFWKIIRQKGKFGKTIHVMENVITSIIDLRHGVTQTRFRYLAG